MFYFPVLIMGNVEADDFNMDGDFFNVCSQSTALPSVNEVN